MASPSAAAAAAPSALTDVSAANAKRSSAAPVFEHRPDAVETPAAAPNNVATVAMVTALLRQHSAAMTAELKPQRDALERRFDEALRAQARTIDLLRSENKSLRKRMAASVTAIAGLAQTTGACVAIIEKLRQRATADSAMIEALCIESVRSGRMTKCVPASAWPSWNATM
jgi:hypothetical protein